MTEFEITEQETELEGELKACGHSNSKQVFHRFCITDECLDCGNVSISGYRKPRPINHFGSYARHT